MQKCFKRISNSNLTAEKLRFRYKRDNTLSNYERADLIDEVALTRPLTILDDSETREGIPQLLFISSKWWDDQSQNFGIELK